MASVKFTETKDFTQYISTASNITSLLLGFLAIVYAFISNDSVGKSLYSINETSKTIVSSVDDVKKIKNDIESSLIQSTAIRNEVSVSVNTFNTELVELKLLISRFSNENENLRNLVSDKIDNLNKSVDEIKNKELFISKDLGKDSNAEQFLETESFIGLLSIWAIEKSYEKNKKIVLNELFDGVKKISYVVGFTNCLCNFTELEIDISGDGSVEDWIIEVEKFDTKLIGANKYIEERIKIEDSTGSKRAQYEKIKKYFDHEDNV